VTLWKCSVLVGVLLANSADELYTDEKRRKATGLYRLHFIMYKSYLSSLRSICEFPLYC
jgi:hypothetical protein